MEVHKTVLIQLRVTIFCNRALSITPFAMRLCNGTNCAKVEIQTPAMSAILNTVYVLAS